MLKLPSQGHDLDTHHNMWRRRRATTRCTEQQHIGYNPHGATHPPQHDTLLPRNAGINQITRLTQREGAHRVSAPWLNSPHRRTGRLYCLSCTQDREILLDLYTGKRDSACPVYRTGRYIASHNIQDREILLVLYTLYRTREYCTWPDSCI